MAESVSWENDFYDLELPAQECAFETLLEDLARKYQIPIFHVLGCVLCAVHARRDPHKELAALAEKAAGVIEDFEIVDGQLRLHGG